MKTLCAASIVLSLVLAGHTFAQSSNATVSGTVADSTGAVLPGVTITVTQTQATGDVDSSTATTTKTTPGAGDAPGSDSVAAIPVGGAWASLLLLGAAALGLRRRGRQPGPQRSGRHHD